MFGFCAHHPIVVNKLKLSHYQQKGVWTQQREIIRV